MPVNDELGIAIDAFDYISPEKISEIVENKIRYAIRSQIKKESDIECVLTNFTAKYILDFEKALREAANKAIESYLVKYSVFRCKDAWDWTESPAVKFLDEECANSRPLIREMVEKHIREYPFHELDRDEIGGVIYDVIT